MTGKYWWTCPEWCTEIDSGFHREAGFQGDEETGRISKWHPGPTWGEVSVGGTAHDDGRVEWFVQVDAEIAVDASSMGPLDALAVDVYSAVQWVREHEAAVSL